MKLIQSEGKHPPKRSQTGIYDQFICFKCEKIFDTGDDYGFKLLYEIIPKKATRHRAYGVEYLELKDFDYKKLKLFAMGLVWKASACRHDFYKRCKLGSAHNAKLKSFIERGDPGESEEYPPIIIGYLNDVGLSHIQDPYIYKLQNRDTLRFVLHRYQIAVKVDARAIEDKTLRLLVPTQHQPLRIVLMNYAESNTLKMAIKAVENNPTAFPQLPEQ